MIVYIIFFIIAIIVIYGIYKYRIENFNYNDLTKDIQMKIIKEMQDDFLKYPTKEKAYLLKQSEGALNTELCTPESKMVEIEESLRAVSSDPVIYDTKIKEKFIDDFDNESILHELDIIDYNEKYVENFDNSFLKNYGLSILILFIVVVIAFIIFMKNK